jgi:hypothetical protein
MRWRERGALALRRTAAGFVIESARGPNFDRPWSRQWPPRKTATDASRTAPSSPGATPRDATPKQDDIEADQ